MRIAALVLVLVVFGPARAQAEWQLKPFAGLTFGGSTTFLDLEQAAGEANLVIGFSGVWLGELVGIDADFGHGPGFFQSGDQSLVAGSSVTTLTGNIVVALPRRLSEYTLRPYFVGGAGLMHVRITDSPKVLGGSSTLAAIDIGGGVTGFLTDRVGLSWDVRRFQSVGGMVGGLSIGPEQRPEQLSFWRANMALAFRY